MVKLIAIIGTALLSLIRARLTLQCVRHGCTALIASGSS